MFNNSPAILMITALALGQAFLAVNILLIRAYRQPVHLALVVFLLAMSFMLLGPWVETFWLPAKRAFIVLYLPVLLLLAPSLWLYVEGLTSEKIWRLGIKQCFHFVLPLFGLVIAFVALSLPVAIQEALLIKGDEKGVALGTPFQKQLGPVNTN